MRIGTTIYMASPVSWYKQFTIGTNLSASYWRYPSLGRSGNSTITCSMLREHVIYCTHVQIGTDDLM